MHQYARYFERYRQLAQSRPVHELLPADTLAQFRLEIETENLAAQAGQMMIERSEIEIERDLRTRNKTVDVRVRSQAALLSCH